MSGDVILDVEDQQVLIVEGDQGPDVLDAEPEVLFLAAGEQGPSGAIALQAHLDDATDAHDASAISLSAVAGLTANNVQSAVAELAGRSAATWGQITGTLADQLDLQAALDAASGSTNLGYTANPAHGTVTSDTGTGATLPLADNTNAGLLSPTQFAQLAGLDAAFLAKQDHSANLDAWSAIATSSKQAADPTLTALAGLATGADKLAYSTGADVFAQTDFTSFGRSIVGAASQAAAAIVLGLTIGTNVQAQSVTLDALAATSYAANALAIGSGANTVSQVAFAANTFPARASTGNLVAKSITDFSLGLLADADAATWRSGIGLGTSATLDYSTNTGLTGGDTALPTALAVKTYVDNAVTGLWDFKGATDCSANPNYPAASKGDAYAVSVAGKIGGASGTAVDVGDVYVASADNAGGTQASVGTSWFVLEHNLAGALLGANNLSDLTDTAQARTNLGLGSLATLSVAPTATALATGRTISISGDLTYTSPSFDGTGNVTAAGTLATVNTTTGTFGTATKVGSFTVNGKGLITAASEITVTPAVGSITGLATGIATFLANPTSSNLLDAVTDETGTGPLVFGTAPTIAGGTHTGITGLAIRSTGAAFDLTFATSEVLTAGRTLSFVLGNVARTLTIGAAASVAGSNTGDQDLSTYALIDSQTFTGTPAAPTAAAGTKTTQISTCAFVDAAEKITVNSKAATYNIVAADQGQAISMTGATAANLAVTSTTSAATFGNGFWFVLRHDGSGASTAANKLLVFTPTTSTIDGASTLTVLPGDIRIIQSNGSNWVSTLIRGGYLRVNVADSPFSLPIPLGATIYQVACWGAGGSGGGGEGRAAVSAVVRSGGGGGGGARCSRRNFNPADLAATITCTVAAGAGTTNGGTTNNGSNGGAGGNSTFGTLLTGYGGGGGGGGGQTASTGGGGGGGGGGTAAGASSTSSTAGLGGAAFLAGASGNVASASANGPGGGNGGAAGGTAGPGGWYSGGGGGGGSGNAAGTNGGGSAESAAGGGSGGGISAANPGISQNGGTGGNTGEGTVTGSGGGGGNGIKDGGTAAQTATQTDTSLGGQGGGGGGGNNGGTGGAGATGTVPGGGGGGGGGGTNIGGQGGNGGAGAIDFWYFP